MTDRVNALIVVLENPTRIDDCEPLIAAIKTFRGVAGVTPKVRDTLDDEIIRIQVKTKLREEILNIFNRDDEK